jgi:hypothetical protein
MKKEAMKIYGFLEYSTIGYDGYVCYTLHPAIYRGRLLNVPRLHFDHTRAQVYLVVLIFIVFIIVEIE